MKSESFLFHSAACVAASLFLLGLAAPSVAASSDDTAKLEALKRAVSEPAEIGTEGKKKHRTRAIVFDNEPETSAAPAPAQAQSGGDCSSLPPDTPSNAVDFAIQFHVGSAEVSPESMNTLTEIGKILSLSPGRCVLVDGHTDATGNADKNLALSKERANSVVRFITEKVGLESKRFVPTGKGSSDPIKGTDPRDPKNRRVVFKVVTR